MNRSVLELDRELTAVRAELEARKAVPDAVRLPLAMAIEQEIALGLSAFAQRQMTGAKRTSPQNMAAENVIALLERRKALCAHQWIDITSSDSPYTLVWCPTCDAQRQCN
jgi:hypothetical protein